MRLATLLRSVLVLAACILLTSVEPTRAADLAATTPCAWLAAFETAYEAEDVAAYGSLLAPEFRFVFADEESRARHPQGFTREDELASYERICHGGAARDGTPLPGAAAIAVDWADVRMDADPEHADEPGRYTIVWVGAATLSIRFDGGNSITDTAAQAFWLMRVDDGAGGSRLVCTRWVERPTQAPTELFAAVPAASAASPASGGIAAGPTWRVWPNPTRSGAGLTYAYEARAAGEAVALELFDVAGRSVVTVARGPAAAGRTVVRWDGRDAGGAVVATGVYFLRVQVGDRREADRVVVLR